MIVRPSLRPVLRSTLRRIHERGSGFSPSLLFATGAQGAWYDPSDLSSMYQDSAGTTPAAVGSPVGLRLDKRLGLVRGAEMVSNGTFASGLSGWTVSGVGGVLANPSGAMSMTNGSANEAGASLDGQTAVVGTWYEVQCTVVSRTGGGTGFVVLGSQNLPLNAATPGVKRGLVYVAVGGSIRIAVGTANSGDGVTVDDVSIRPLPGNHASQSTSASRPVLQQDAGGRYYPAADGLDDSLTTAAGGGATAGFFFCAAIQPSGGAATFRTLWSDRGTNTGYAVRISDTEHLEFMAGNGTAYTSIGTGALLPIGETHVVTAWDDGSSLNVQVDRGTVASVARPVVSAGTAGFTICKANGAAAQFFSGRDYGMVVLGRAPTPSEITRTQRWLAARAGVAL